MAQVPPVGAPLSSSSLPLAEMAAAAAGAMANPAPIPVPVPPPASTTAAENGRAPALADMVLEVDLRFDDQVAPARVNQSAAHIVNHQEEFLLYQPLSILAPSPWPGLQTDSNGFVGLEDISVERNYGLSEISPWERPSTNDGDAMLDFDEDQLWNAQSGPSAIELGSQLRTQTPRNSDMEENLDEGVAMEEDDIVGEDSAASVSSVKPAKLLGQGGEQENPVGKSASIGNSKSAGSRAIRSTPSRGQKRKAASSSSSSSSSSSASASNAASSTSSSASGLSSAASSSSSFSSASSSSSSSSSSTPACSCSCSTCALSTTIHSRASTISKRTRSRFSASSSEMQDSIYSTTSSSSSFTRRFAGNPQLPDAVSAITELRSLVPFVTRGEFDIYNNMSVYRARLTNAGTIQTIAVRENDPLPSAAFNLALFTPSLFTANEPLQAAIDEIRADHMLPSIPPLNTIFHLVAARRLQFPWSGNSRSGHSNELILSFEALGASYRAAVPLLSGPRSLFQSRYASSYTFELSRTHGVNQTPPEWVRLSFRSLLANSDANTLHLLAERAQQKRKLTGSYRYGLCTTYNRLGDDDASYLEIEVEASAPQLVQRFALHLLQRKGNATATTNTSGLCMISSIVPNFDEAPQMRPQNAALARISANYGSSSYPAPPSS